MKKDTALVTGATGAITSRSGPGISRVFREAQGIHHIIFQSGFARPLADFHIGVTPVGAAARIMQLGPGAAPGGANLASGETSQQVLTFDAAGAAQDADFSVEVQRR